MVLIQPEFQIQIGAHKPDGSDRPANHQNRFLCYNHELQTLAWRYCDGIHKAIAAYRSKISPDRHGAVLYGRQPSLVRPSLNLRTWRTADVHEAAFAPAFASDVFRAVACVSHETKKRR